MSDITVESIVATLEEHHPEIGIMASPNHWAYHKGWFAHCGSGNGPKGCGWDSYPNTYDTREEARTAAFTHLAHMIQGEQ